MTPTFSAYLAAFDTNPSMGESVRHGVSGVISADNAPSEGDGINSEFLARHTADRHLAQYPWYFTIDGTLGRHTATAVDPVVSIPAGGDFAPTHIQWRRAAEQSVDDASIRVHPTPIARVVSHSPGHSSASQIINAIEPITGAGSPAESLYENCRLLCASLTESGSWPEEGRSSTAIPEAAAQPLRHSLADLIYDDDFFSEGEAADIVTGVDTQLDSLADSSGFCGSEALNWFKEGCAAVEQELSQRMEQEAQLLQAATAQSAGKQSVGDIVSLFHHVVASLTDLRCRMLAVERKVESNFVLVDQLSAELKKMVLPQILEEEAKQPADGSPGFLCAHYCRRCYLWFPCCSEYFACHLCHNESGKCGNNELEPWQATHLKCTQCQVEQEINEDSQHCSACSVLLSDYFCGICKLFTSVENSPFHCHKCGVCRGCKDKSFHCDVCNMCLDKKLEGKHKCRSDSGHDECCVCLEDAFSGCQVLPCSHKVHKQCGIDMVKNGVRTCPVCRHPLFPADDGP